MNWELFWPSLAFHVSMKILKICSNFMHPLYGWRYALHQIILSKTVSCPLFFVLFGRFCGGWGFFLYAVISLRSFLIYAIIDYIVLPRTTEFLCDKTRLNFMCPKCLLQTQVFSSLHNNVEKTGPSWSGPVFLKNAFWYLVLVTIWITSLFEHPRAIMAF